MKKFNKKKFVNHRDYKVTIKFIGSIRMLQKSWKTFHEGYCT